MSIIPGEILKFIRTKEFTFVRNIGQGGTGKTVLVKDEVTEIDFVCKKYSPYDIDKKTEYFTRFIEEIRIMYLLSNKNVVRIYTYFLYPEHTTGYILMEYIDGSTIDEYLWLQTNDVHESIFIQLLEGFEYLERNNVLHRDIRNQNILITNDGIVKIIDFGFGKKIESTTSNNAANASVLLNWPVSEFPEEIKNYQYNHQTEVYFVGKLFNKILEENGIDDFRYQHAIDKMIITNPDKRIKSFAEILQSISADLFEENDFTDTEKAIYRILADRLTSHINAMVNERKLVVEPKEIITSLEIVLRNSLLEEFLQDNSRLISCFVKNTYNYSTRKDIPVKDIRNFYKMIKQLSPIKQKILLDNMCSRLNSIPIKLDEDDIPF